MRMDKDICKVMFNEVELQGVCKRLGEQITKDYEGKDLLIVGILNGAIVFVTDLMRQIDRQINIDFMSVSSYGSGTRILIPISPAAMSSSWRTFWIPATPCTSSPRCSRSAIPPL